MWTTVIRQMWNERKGNSLIWFELVIVAAFMWYTVDALYIAYKNYTRPLGFDINHTYHISLAAIDKESEAYDQAASDAETPGDYFFTILDRIGRNPQVEAVCYTSNNHFHYKWSNQFSTFKNDSLSRNGYVRNVSPSYFQVFNVQSANDRDREELGKVLERNEIVITNTVANTFFGNTSNAMSKEIRCIIQNEDSALYKIGAVCEAQRTNDFREYDYAFYRNIPADQLRKHLGSPAYMNIFIRIKANNDSKAFPEKFRKEMREQLHVGNCYLANITPMSEYREQQIREGLDQMRMNSSVIGFFLLNVLLGVVGTFWLRTQRKQGEIGLRLAVGSSQSGIARLLFLEGNILLLAAFIPATLIFINLQYAGVIESVYGLPFIPRFLTGMIITYLLLAGMMGVGISFPAWRAVKISPVKALHYE